MWRSRCSISQRDPDLEHGGAAFGAGRGDRGGSGRDTSRRRGASSGRASCWSGTRRGSWRSSGTRFLFNFAVFPLTNGLMPYAARDIFGTDQTGLGYLIASVAAGAFIGSIIMTRSGMRMELARIMIVAAVIWHILVLVFAQTHDAVGRHRHADAVRLRPEPDHGLPHRDPAQRLDPALPRPDHGGADAGDLQPAARACSPPAC